MMKFKNKNGDYIRKKQKQYFFEKSGKKPLTNPTGWSIIRHVDEPCSGAGSQYAEVAELADAHV